MRYRQLGRTGVKVSELCLGTMTFGEQNSEAEGHRQMDYAVDCGINIFDAAEIYPCLQRLKPRATPSRSSAPGSRARTNATRLSLPPRSLAAAPLTSCATSARRPGKAQRRSERQSRRASSG